MQWADNLVTACSYLELQLNCFEIQKLSYIAILRKEWGISDLQLRYPQSGEGANKSFQVPLSTLYIISLIYKQDCHCHRMISTHKEVVVLVKNLFDCCLNFTLNWFLDVTYYYSTSSPMYVLVNINFQLKFVESSHLLIMFMVGLWYQETWWFIWTNFLAYLSKEIMQR